MKDKYLAELAKLDEKVLEKLASLSKSEKALSYFKNPALYAILKGFLKIK
ncbi:hypothetical protein ACILDT_09855 [Capnocytophaga canis]